MSERFRTDAGVRYRFLAWVAVGIVYVLLRLNLLDIPLDRDEGLFGYIGQVIRDGGLPYRDVVDHKPPLVHFLYAFITSFLPPEATAIHLFLQVYNFLTLMACYYLAKLLTNSRLTGLWTALVFAVMSTLPSLRGHVASTEMFMLLPATLCLACAVRTLEQPRLGWHLSSGVMGGFTVLTKPSGAPLVLFAFAVIAASTWTVADPWQKRLAALTRRGFVFASGFLAPLTLVVAYFFHRQAFTDLVRWVVSYNLLYMTHWPRRAFGDGLQFMLAEVGSDALPALAVALGTTCLLLLRRERIGIFLAGFLVASLVATLPLLFRHYIAQTVPALALAAGVGLSRLYEWIPRGPWRRLALVVFSALVVGSPVLVHPLYYITGDPESLTRMLYGLNPFAEAKPVADFVAARTAAADRVFVLGSEAEILFQASRKGSSRFALKYPMMVEWCPNYLDYQHAAIVALSTRPPKYIVVVNSPASVLWDGRTPFPLHDFVESLTRSRYELEASQPLTEPQSQLIHGENARAILADTDFHKPHTILVYRRRQPGS